jgi:hypothetical protein
MTIVRELTDGGKTLILSGTSTMFNWIIYANKLAREGK